MDDLWSHHATVRTLLHLYAVRTIRLLDELSATVAPCEHNVRRCWTLDRQFVQQSAVEFTLEVCGSRFSATYGRYGTRPVPDDAYPYPTRAENCYPTSTRPAGIPVPYPVGLPLLGWYNRPSGLPRPGPLQCISSGESIFCCGEHVLQNASSS